MKRKDKKKLAELLKQIQNFSPNSLAYRHLIYNQASIENELCLLKESDPNKCSSLKGLWANFLSLEPGGAYAEHVRKQLELPKKGRRLAFLLGNWEYQAKPLSSPRQDITTMFVKLNQLQFDDVFLFDNLTLGETLEKLEEFEKKINENDVVLFYYSGHGNEVDYINYLIPKMEIEPQSKFDIRDKAISLPKVLDSIKKARLKIVILDACRDNPFEGGKSFGGGLAPMGVMETFFFRVRNLHFLRSLSRTKSRRRGKRERKYLYRRAS